MLHLRIIAPSERRAEVERLLEDSTAVTHVVVLPGAARQPAGDLLLADVVREGASDVLAGLRGLDVDRDGAIVMENVDVALSRSADRAARRTPGLGVDAVVWEEIEHRTGEETQLSGAYLAFLTVATVIAGIGVLLDQPILIVGASRGPEFVDQPSGTGPRLDSAHLADGRFDLGEVCRCPECGWLDRLAGALHAPSTRQPLVHRPDGNAEPVGNVPSM